MLSLALRCYPCVHAAGIETSATELSNDKCLRSLTHGNIAAQNVFETIEEGIVLTLVWPYNLAHMYTCSL